ncbi:MAG: IS110 family transposase [Phycisphaerae bacterium]|nr:IS110 family transposase [Phycisphaerae bacterium]NIU58293.1 IS110 family transposase [Phycisphaerae bacterium]NIW94555.1 IS110 family transposase [Phycisphaerae bacterium]
MNDSITYVAMDTHKKEHSVALHHPGQEEIVRFTVRNTAREITKMTRKIIKRAPGGVEFCYEAGVCGFVLKRRIEAHGCHCVVIAPSLIPRKPGERIKTDRRDALKLLTLFRAGLLTEVHAPDSQQEAARELTRCRQAVQENLKRVRHQLLKFLTRHGYLYSEGNHWTGKHLKWLRSLEFEEMLLQDVFDNYFTELQHCLQRLSSLDKQVEKLAKSEPYQTIVGLLRCFHGIDTLSAITIITEIFDFGRFSSPGELMSYLGLTCSEFSSGDKQKRGPITRAGNKRVRRILVEVSWHYRHPCNISKALRERRKDQPQWIIDIADRAGQRLRKRYRHLMHCGKMPCKVSVAIARELAGFIWSVFQEYEARKNGKQAA